MEPECISIAETTDVAAVLEYTDVFTFTMHKTLDHHLVYFLCGKSWNITMATEIVTIVTETVAMVTQTVNMVTQTVTMITQTVTRVTQTDTMVTQTVAMLTKSATTVP